MKKQLLRISFLMLFVGLSAHWARGQTANAGPDRAYCTNYVTLEGNQPDIGNTGYWTIVNGTGIIENSTLFNTVVSNVGPGVNIFKWTIQASSDNVEIKNDSPYPTNIMADTHLYSFSTSVSQPPPTVGEGLWTIQSGGGTLSSPSSYFTDISDLPAGTTVVRWTLTNNGCVVQQDKYISVYLPDAGSDQNVCSNSVTMNAVTPSAGFTGIWSTYSEAIPDDENDPQTTFYGLMEGENIFIWTVGELTDTVRVFNNEPGDPTALSDVYLCNDSFYMAVEPAINGVGQWSVQSGTGTIEDLTNTNTWVTGLTSGQFIARWTITNGSCSKFSEQVISVQYAEAGLDQERCSSEAQLNAVPATVGFSGYWSPFGSQLIADNTLADTDVSFLYTGLNKFIWHLSSADCANSADTVDIMNNYLEVISIDDANYCGNPINLDLYMNQTGYVGSWTVIQGGISIDDIEDPNTSVDYPTADIVKLEWTANKGVCQVIDTLTFYNRKPEAFAGSDITVCSTFPEGTLNGNKAGFECTVYWDASTYGYAAIDTSYKLNAAFYAYEDTNTVTLRIFSAYCDIEVADDVNIYVYESIITPASQSVCGDFSSLSTVSLPGIWSVASGSGFPNSPNSGNTVISNLSRGSNAIVWTNTLNGCTDTAYITNSMPYSNAGSDFEVCSNSATLNAFVPAGATNGVWSTSGGATIVNPTSKNSAVTGLVAGPNEFVWTVDSLGCTSIDNVLIINNTVSITGSGDHTVCSNNQTELNMSAAPVGGSGIWSIVNGDGIFSNESSHSVLITNIPQGANKFRWTVTLGTCSNYKDVNVNNSTVSANAGSDQSACANMLTLAAVTPDFGIGTWTGPAGVVFGDNTSPSTTVSNVPLGANNFTWTVNNGSCGFFDVVVITNNEFSLGEDVNESICVGTYLLNSSQPTVNQAGAWTSTSGLPIFDNSTLYNSTVNNLQVGLNELIWTVTDTITSCVASTTVFITNNGFTVSVEDDKVSCDFTTTLTADPLDGGQTGMWSDDFGNSNIDLPNESSTGVSGLDPGKNTFIWTVTSLDGCTSTDSIDVNAIDVFEYAGDDEAICSDSYALNADDLSVDQTGYWTINSGAGIFVDSTDPKTIVNGLDPFDNFLQWNVTEFGCLSTNEVIITNNGFSVNAGTDTPICSSTYFLQADEPASGTGTWSGPVGVVFSNENSPTSDVSQLPSGSTTLEWTVDNGFCVLQDNVVITNNQVTAEAGPNSPNCTDSYTLEGNTPSAGATGAWSKIGGDGVITNSTLPNSTVTGLQSGLSTFMWTVILQNCTVTDVVEITTEIFVVNAGSDAPVCTDTHMLNATPAGQSGAWRDVANTAIFADTTLASSQVSILNIGVNTLVWTVIDGACTASDTVVITYNPLPVYAGADQTVCVPTAMLNATDPQGGETGTWTKVNGGTANIPLPNMAQTGVSNLSLGANTFVWTLSNGACTSSDTVVITYEVFDLGLPAELHICADTVVLNATFYQGATYNWNVSSGAGIFSNPSDAQTTVSDIVAGTNIYRLSLVAQNCAVTDSVKVIYEPVFSNAGSDLTTCDNFATLEAIVVNYAGTWLTQGQANIESPSNAITNVTNLALGENVFIWRVSSPYCVVYDMVSVFNNTPAVDILTSQIADTMYYENAFVVSNASYLWEFGDGNISNLANPKHKYASMGVFNVCLTVKDTISGCVTKVCEEVTYGTFDCLADFSWTAADLALNFTDMSVGQIQVWQWNFGDGNTSDIQNPAHTYTKPGVYKVSLTVFDPVKNCMASKSYEIKVGTMPCVAEYSYFVDFETLTLTLDNVSTGDLTSYFWAFGDNSFSTEFEPTHQYAEPGVYNVCLTVFNSATNCQSKVCYQVQIGANQLQPEFTYVADNANLLLKLNGSSTGNVSSWYWTFGDGNFDQGQNVEHTYKQAGVYNVKLTVVDGTNGSYAEYMQQVKIGTITCTAEAKYTYFVQTENNTVSFADQSVGNLTTWYWNFGDGQTSQEVSPEHTFAEAGYYLVTLSVKDNVNGCADVYYEFILVGQVECIARFDSKIDQSNLKVEFFNESEAVNAAYFWYFGDGNYSEEAEPVHIFSKPGYYQVSLAVIGQNGVCSDYTTEFIQVGKIECSAAFEYAVDFTNNTVTFIPTSIGNATKYQWLFGDGSYSTVPQAEYQYPKPGYYIVSLMTFDEQTACSDKSEQIILVSQEGIDCQADFYYQPNMSNRTVAFKDNSQGTGLSYIWDFGDGSTSDQKNPAHQYTQGGYHNVCLTVTNASGISNMNCQQVLVSDEEATNCLANFIYQVSEGSSSAKFIDKSVGQISKWSWEFGDTQISDQQNPLHQYGDTAFYVVKLAVETSSGCRSVFVDMVGVGTKSKTMKAGFANEQDTANSKPSGYPVDYYGTGNGNKSKTKWTFGATKASDNTNTTTLTPTYVYAAPGNYNVCLEISDPVLGVLTTTCKTVTVVEKVGISGFTWLDASITSYPNPFRSQTTIEYTIGETIELEMIVRDMMGREVSRLYNGVQQSGTHFVEWNADNNLPGIYYLELRSNKGFILHKLVLTN